MRIIYDEADRVRKFVQENLKVVISPPYTAIGFSRNGSGYCGGVVFNHFNLSNVDITLYAPGCFSRETIRAVYAYAFKQVKVLRVTAMTRRSNHVMRQLLPRLGFSQEPEGMLPKYFGPSRSDDAFVFGLYAEQAEKWL